MNVTKLREYLLQKTNNEVTKMGESQSRYGIIEELNNRKINQKEKLANIERETDKKVYDTERDLGQLRQVVSDKESSYELEHKDTIRDYKVNLDLLRADFKRNEIKITEATKEENEGYKKKFLDWKKEQMDFIEKQKEELKVYKTIQEKKIQEKKDIIGEIEKGISDLKEVSKESQGSD